MKFAVFLILGLTFFNVKSQNKSICITIDDLPLVSYGLNDSLFLLETTKKLTRTVSDHKLPVIGYVVENQLYENDTLNHFKLTLLKKWLDAGADLGNHSYSHYDYNNVSHEVYFSDILRGEQNIKPLLKEYGKSLKYFRHPYLHTGSTKIASDSLDSFLTLHNYIPSPVTIDNDDYLFAYAYHKSFLEKDSAKMKSIGSAYVKYMKEKVLFFENKSEELFGEPIPQTLLIHASLLNADYLSSLVEMYKALDYKVISQDEVLKHPAYQTKVSVYSRRGLSWLYRWAYSKGETEAFTKGDPETPKEIVELAK